MAEPETIEFLKSFGMSEEYAHQLSAGFDILTDAGYSREKIEGLLGACIRQGENPEAMARKVVRFGKIVSGGSPTA